MLTVFYFKSIACGWKNETLYVGETRIVKGGKMEGKITKKGELKVGNEVYLYKIDLDASNQDAPTRSGYFLICNKNFRSAEISSELLGPYYHSNDVFIKSLIEFMQEYLKEHTFDEFQQYIKSEPKVEIADVRMNFSQLKYILYQS